MFPTLGMTFLILLIVIVSVCLPLLLRTKTPPDRAQYDLAVYNDQLHELEREVGRGTLTPTEADAARLEIQRRVLAVTPDHEATIGKRDPHSLRMAGVIGTILLVGAGGMYLARGAPSLPDQPFSDRGIVSNAASPDGASPDAAKGGTKPAPHTNMQAAAEKLREQLEKNPNDGPGWALLARTESVLGDFDKAGGAYQRAIDLGQKDPDIYASYGEMQVLAAQGVVSPAARDAFQSARAADPSNNVARFYLALADSQAGDVHKAVDEWLSLAADLPDDSPMRPQISQNIADAAKSGNFPAPPLPKGVVAPPPAPDASAAAPSASDTSGPTPAQMDDASKMSDADRNKLIHTMVDQLAARLKDKPDDVDGWLRLGQAYAVEGETDKAIDAYDHAMKLAPNDPAIKLRAVEALISRLQPADPLPPRAVELLHEVAAVQPDAPEVLWYLGVVAAREGRPDEARQKWTKLLGTLSKGDDDYQLVQSALAKLAGPANNAN